MISVGRSTRSVPKTRMSQKKLDSLITNPSPDFFENKTKEEYPILTGCAEYDTLHPEETFKHFCCSVRELLSRYEQNSSRLSELDQQMQDLLHYIELSGDKNANAGYKLYKQIAIVRRERRACKNEMDLLQPVYDAFQDDVLLNKLYDIQAKCRNAKRQIDNRAYTVRTDVLKDL